MAKTRLGFDIGSNSMKVAIHQGSSFRVEEVRLPENLVDESGNITLPHAFSQFLKQQKKELSLPRGPASLVLPTNQVICRLVTMPKMTTDQLLMNLPYEFTDFVEGAADQYFCDYALCTPTEEESGTGVKEETAENEGQEEAENSPEQVIPMMAAVASKQTLGDYVQMFARAGIKLKTLLPQEMALIEMVRRHGGGAEEFCFVDLGHQATRITVVWRDRVQATRQINLGGRNLDLAVADQMGVEPFLANTYKAGNYQGIQMEPLLTDLCDRIAVEILKVINFYQFTYRGSSLEGIYLVGGGAAMANLRVSIEDTVGLPLLSLEDFMPGAGFRSAAGFFAAGSTMGGK